MAEAEGPRLPLNRRALCVHRREGMCTRTRDTFARKHRGFLKSNIGAPLLPYHALTAAVKIGRNTRVLATNGQVAKTSSTLERVELTL